MMCSVIGGFHWVNQMIVKYRYQKEREGSFLAENDQDELF